MAQHEAAKRPAAADTTPRLKQAVISSLRRTKQNQSMQRSPDSVSRSPSFSFSDDGDEFAAAAAAPAADEVASTAGLAGEAAAAGGDADCEAGDAAHGAAGDLGAAGDAGAASGEVVNPMADASATAGAAASPSACMATEGERGAGDGARTAAGLYGMPIGACTGSTT